MAHKMCMHALFVAAELMFVDALVLDSWSTTILDQCVDGTIEVQPQDGYFINLETRQASCVSGGPAYSDAGPQFPAVEPP